MNQIINIRNKAERDFVAQVSEDCGWKVEDICQVSDYPCHIILWDSNKTTSIYPDIIGDREAWELPEVLK